MLQVLTNGANYYGRFLVHNMCPTLLLVEPKMSIMSLLKVLLRSRSLLGVQLEPLSLAIMIEEKKG